MGSTDIFYCFFKLLGIFFGPFLGDLGNTFSTYFQRLCLGCLWARLFEISDAKKRNDFVSAVLPLGAPWATRLVLEGRMCAQSAPKTSPWQPKRVPKSTQVAKNDAKRYTKNHKTIFKLILHSKQRTPNTLSEKRPGGLREALK